MIRKNIRIYGKRLLFSFLAALAFVAVINEAAHLWQKEITDRPTETVELVIPPGTAERVAAGEAVPSIPEELVFVVGDTLKVVNEDNANHELGPLYIPAGSSASLLMEDANKYVLGCSFQPTKYLGFDVRSRTTAISRIQAFALATPPTGMFFFVYSLLVFPVKKKEHNNSKPQTNSTDKSLI